MLSQRPAVLNRFRHVRLADGCRTREVGNGSRYLQDAMIGARRPVQPRHCSTQQLFTCGIRFAVRVDLGRRQRVVALSLPVHLRPECLLDARCDDG